MSRFKMAFDLENMTPAPAGAATPKVIYRTDDGIMLCYGTTKPADAAVGYAPGCLFIDVDGNSISTVLFTNIGTNVSADFDPWSGSVTQQAHIADPAATASDITDSTTGTASVTHTLVDAAGDDYVVAEHRNNYATLAAEYNALKADVEANNAAIDALLAALETAGVLAAA